MRKRNGEAPASGLATSDQGYTQWGTFLSVYIYIYIHNGEATSRNNRGGLAVALLRFFLLGVTSGQK